MTLLEALQSMVEYTNANLLSKALTDRGLTATATYAKADKEKVELCAADVYMALAAHPEFREGSRVVKYDGNTLKALAQAIYNEYDEDEPTIDGSPLW